ncbi:MAG: MFS transporter [Planctomyces sp.]|nr:MFS transporter [Planctomyces sp.]
MSNESSDPARATPLPALTRRVVASQVLFSAGNTLTVGGFFNYFVSGYGPSALWLATLQAAPEFFETAGLFVRPLVLRLFSRKTLWMAGLLIGRSAALAIPLLAVWLGPDAPASLILPAILACLAVWHVCQGLGYVAYLSWLSDLAPERRWGRFFASRQSAALATSLIVYTSAILASQWARRTLPPGDRTTFFVGAFLLGGAIVLSSVLPMLRVPSVPTRTAAGAASLRTMLRRALRTPGFRNLLGWACHLALFQGLTQAVITKFQIEVLTIPLHWFLAMHGLMLVLQTVWNLVAGRISDRIGDVRVLTVSSFAVGTALLFTLAATPETWFLQFGAYAVWGLFGAVNLCSQTLALRLAPRSDNTVQLALFRPVTGFLAAVAGLFGGWALDRLLREEWSLAVPWGVWTGFQLLFAISLFGRLTAPLWLLGIEDPAGDANH